VKRKLKQLHKQLEVTGLKTKITHERKAKINATNALKHLFSKAKTTILVEGKLIYV
jgi:archaellum component FlaF (FlaF/FlaG flagellin family)